MKFLVIALVFYLASSVHGADKSVETACGIVPDGTYIADPNDCNKFFKCESEKPIPGSCSNSTKYSVVDNACMKNAICVKEFQKIVCRNRNKDEKVADPANCKNYYTCDKSQKATSENSTACEKKEVFDPNEQNCVPEGKYECPPDNHCTLIADKIFTAHSDKNKCFAYYLCMNNIPIAGECLYDSKYNSKAGACDYDLPCSVVECDHTKKTPISTTCSKYHTCKNNKLSAPLTCEKKLHFDAEKAECVNAYSMDTPCKYDRCENMPDGFFVVELGTECKKYNYCVNGESYYAAPMNCNPDHPYLSEEYQQCTSNKPDLAICN
ncbi:hypothetical protein ACFFRR_010372 [Megaselia abdita]